MVSLILMERGCKNKKGTMISSSGMDISNRSHNFKELLKANKRR